MRCRWKKVAMASQITAEVEFKEDNPQYLFCTVHAKVSIFWTEYNSQKFELPVR